MTTRLARLPGPRAHALAFAAALALLPGAAQAQARKAAPASPLVGRWELGGGFGLASPLESGIDTGFKLAAEGFYGQQPLTPTVLLQLGGSVGWGYNGGPLGYSLHTIDLLPTARLRGQVAPSVFLAGDFGLGMAILRSSVDVPVVIPPGVLVTQSATSTDASIVIKLGGGVGFDLNRQWSLTLEPAFCIYAKSSSVTQFTLLFGALYRP